MLENMILTSYLDNSYFGASWGGCRKHANDVVRQVFKHKISVAWQNYLAARHDFHVALGVTLYHEWKTSRCHDRCIFNINIIKAIKATFYKLVLSIFFNHHDRAYFVNDNISICPENFIIMATKSLQWATTVTANENLPQQTHHGKFKYATANLNRSRQVQIRHGQFKVTTANPNSPHQIQIHHGKIKFTVANSISPWQLKIYHNKFKFTTENSDSKGQIKFATVKPKSPLQIQIQVHCGKSKFIMSNSNSRRQIQIHHIKFKFARQIEIDHGKFTFSTADSNSLRKTQHGKFKFTRGKI